MLDSLGFLKNICLCLPLLFGLTAHLIASELCDDKAMEVQEWGYGYLPKPCNVVRATLFYFKPTIDQSSYVITSTNNRVPSGDSTEVFPNGQRHLIRTHYKPGFSIEGLFKLCDRCNLLDLRLTYFNSFHSRSTSGDFLFDTIGYVGDGAQAPEDTTYAGTATIHHHYLFWGADATLNRLIFDCCPDHLSFLFGLRYSSVGFTQSFTSLGSFINDNGAQLVNNRFRQKSSFWGIGPQIGVEYHYPLMDENLGCITLNARTRGALLCSSTCTELHYNSERTGNVGVNLRNDRLWRVNPSANAQLGISYDICCCGMQTTLELGYEFFWCSKCVNKITSYDVAFAGDTLDLFNDLSLQGPFLSLNAIF